VRQYAAQDGAATGRSDPTPALRADRPLKGEGKGQITTKSLAASTGLLVSTANGIVPPAPLPLMS
jgi:hypothetical protein